MVQTNDISVWECLRKRFTFHVKNWFFSPKSTRRGGTWDGKICLLKGDGSVPIGLLDIIIDEIIPKYELKAKVTFDNRLNYNRDKIEGWVDSLNLPFEPRDYQFRAFFDSICKRVNGVVSITGSGKSLIIYLLARFFQKINKQVLIIVPTIQLVDQMFDDFYDYNFTDIDKYVQKIKAGMTKEFKSPIVISTWQSISPKQFKLTTEHFAGIGAVIVDECHGADGKTLVSIQEHCINASYKVGLSGTVPETDPSEYYTLVGLFGKFTEYLSYQEAFDKGYISPMTLNAIFLDYPEADRKHIYENKKDYQYEIDYVYRNKRRNLFLMNLINGFDKNTLILFTKIETHGKILHDFIKAHSDKTVYYIDGVVKDTVREEIRRKMEKENNVILLASFGTLSTGINIKNIHNVVFASAYRSEIKTFQSIGRGLRLLDDKHLQVYDIVDLLSHRNGAETYNNYLINQFHERLGHYKQRDFSIVKKTVTI